MSDPRDAADSAEPYERSVKNPTGMSVGFLTRAERLSLAECSSSSFSLSELLHFVTTYAVHEEDVLTALMTNKSLHPSGIARLAYDRPLPTSAMLALVKGPHFEHLQVHQSNALDRLLSGKNPAVMRAAAERYISGRRYAVIAQRGTISECIGAIHNPLFDNAVMNALLMTHLLRWQHNGMVERTDEEAMEVHRVAVRAELATLDNIGAYFIRIDENSTIPLAEVLTGDISYVVRKAVWDNRWVAKRIRNLLAEEFSG